MSRKRYAVVGTGGRAVTFLDAIAGPYRDSNELVGLCDLSSTRMRWHNGRLQALFQHPPLPMYPAAEFDRMVRETKPDIVLVTTMDCTHHEYIARAMDLGCDVLCEKPMTIDAPRTKTIFDAIARTGRHLRVAFNYRYAPTATKVCELLRQGVVGRPLAVDFSWVLDTSHGADYFRRWHREKDKSGGLLVHKATHHFDLVNWWINSWPQRVFALGELKFYGRTNAEARGERYAYARYTGVPAAARDPFALSLDPGPEAAADPYGKGTLKGLYLDAEADSGYLRDRNVFGEPISIEDTMTVTAQYRNGVLLNYSLLAYSPWEGYRVAITGTKGRLELYDKHGSHIIAGQSDDQLAAAQARGLVQEITVFPMFGVPYKVETPEGEGGHGGADPVMLRDLFDPNPPSDPFRRAASHLDGAASILMGISANESIRTGEPVDCDRLFPLPEHP